MTDTINHAAQCAKAFIWHRKWDREQMTLAKFMEHYCGARLEEIEFTIEDVQKYLVLL